ncbi:MAG: hypothetical protein M3R17_19415 [Bacteroidota bacterium]|nr:hypothetical protein [Bacteroidota bacterium]
MKNIFLLGIPFFLLSCGDNNSAVNIDSLKTDSLLRAQMTAKAPDTTPVKDTTKGEVLPPVFEGDIVMQISQNPKHLAFGKACGSKYNHTGIIFIRPKDRMYVVMEANDTVTALPLREWATRGEGKHIVVLRLKDSKQLLTEKKTMQLKKGAKDFRGKKEDNFYGWSDDAFYSTELVWKVYNKSIAVAICEPGRLGDMNLTETVFKEQMTKKYGGTIPAEEKFISPDAIYKSPKLEIIYER